MRQIRPPLGSRMYLTKPRKPGKDEEDDDSDPNARVLKTMKNNQGPGSGSIALRWESGVFINETPAINPGFLGKIELDSLTQKMHSGR
jgi:hypothetical protein